MSNGSDMKYKHGDLVVYKSVGEMEWQYGYCPIKIGIIVYNGVQDEFHIAYRNKNDKENVMWFRGIREGEIIKKYIGVKEHPIRQMFKLSLVLDELDAWREMGRRIP
jgi:hypothetical protein